MDYSPLTLPLTEQDLLYEIGGFAFQVCKVDQVQFVPSSFGEKKLSKEVFYYFDR